MKTRSTIQFILDDEIVRVKDVDPSMSLLQYLRDRLHRNGTKEGCAEGDCGACTVVIGELPNQQDQKLKLRSINACLVFLPMIDGKVLFTVESLSAKGAKLHPVQQAMVDHHASQCGFCTPGFVMSLFALYKTVAQPDREQINDHLSGNLCRCTGYRPIIDAAKNMSQLAADAEQSWINLPASSADIPQQLIDQLKSIQAQQTLQVEYAGQQYFAPSSVDDLLQLKHKFPQATLVAGNTDVGLWVNKKLQELPVVISLASVAVLKQIEVSDDHIQIGAAVTLEASFVALKPYFPTLDELFRRFASMPIRNAGTLVGNIANGSPIGDSMPVLLALDAQVLLSSVNGKRQIPLHQFYLGYQQKDLKSDEIVEAVMIPRESAADRIASYKIAKRFDQDISAVCAAFVMRLDEAGHIEHIRIAFGGMAAIPARASKTEQVLLGQVFNQASIDEAKFLLHEDFAPLSDMRASATYRMKISQNLLQRFYLESIALDSLMPLSISEVSA